MSIKRMTAAQLAVFAGHTERFSYQINAAEGLRQIFRCEELGLTRSQLTPKKKQRDVRQYPPFSVWFLDGQDDTTYRSLGAVADAIIFQRILKARAENAAVLRNSRCGQDSARVSVPQYQVTE